MLIGLSVVVNRYDLFEAFRDILSELSELELHPKKDLLSLYEQLAVKYEASNTSKEEFQKEVNLRKIMPLLSFELEDLAKECQEYQGLLADLSNSHHVRDDLVNQETMCVYKVKNETQAMVFNPKGKATCLLGHVRMIKIFFQSLRMELRPIQSILHQVHLLEKGLILLNTLENICLLRK